jgi:hypothetical protein
MISKVELSPSFWKPGVPRSPESTVADGSRPSARIRREPWPTGCAASVRASVSPASVK